MELAQATLLRTLAAKHRLGVVRLERSGTLRHQIVLHHRTHNAGRTLGTQGQALLCLELGVGALFQHARKVGAREHAEHLFAHHVRGLTNAMHKDINLLDSGSLDRLEAIRLKHAGGNLLHMLPRAHLATDQILSTFCLLCLHGAHLSFLHIQTPNIIEDTQPTS